MKLTRSLLVPLSAIILLLFAGAAWAAPLIEIFDATTTTVDGNVDHDFRMGKRVVYKIGYRFTVNNAANRDVTAKVLVDFADGDCVKEYTVDQPDVAPDVDHWVEIVKKVPLCASPGNWAPVTYTIDINSTIATANGAIFIYPPAEPVARFKASPRYGEVSPGNVLRVFFADKSLGTVTDHAWDFGDGDTSTERNPVHEYDNYGKFDVTLTITGPNGSDTLTKEDYITVVDPASILKANFGVPRAERVVAVPAGETTVTVAFNDKSQGVEAGATYLWDFGDGDTSGDVGPTSHDYELAEGQNLKAFTVTLTVTNPSGETSVKTKTNYLVFYRFN